MNRTVSTSIAIAVLSIAMTQPSVALNSSVADDALTFDDDTNAYSVVPGYGATVRITNVGSSASTSRSLES